jgi:hypothetical protein
VFRSIGCSILLLPLLAATARADDAGFIARPEVSKLVVADGVELAARIGPDGAFRSNARGDFVIDGQRRAYDVVAAGVASSRNDLVARGLSALEWGFAHAAPDGSFPDEDGANPRARLARASFFVGAAARSLVLIQQSPSPPQLKARAAALRPPLQRSATWIANGPGFQDFLQGARNTNQVAIMAWSLAAAGQAIGDPRLGRKADQLMREALRRQRPDGVFPERRGFDTNYQSVTLEALAHYADMIPPGPGRARLTAALRKGTTRLVHAIDRQGRIDAGSNTRTVPCGPAVGGDRAKGISTDVQALRLYYVAYTLGDGDLALIADAVQRNGQRFTHIEECRGRRR